MSVPEIIFSCNRLNGGWLLTAPPPRIFVQLSQYDIKFCNVFPTTVLNNEPLWFQASGIIQSSLAMQVILKSQTKFGCRYIEMVKLLYIYNYRSSGNIYHSQENDTPTILIFITSVKGRLALILPTFMYVYIKLFGWNLQKSWEMA